MNYSLSNGQYNDVINIYYRHRYDAQGYLVYYKSRSVL